MFALAGASSGGRHEDIAIGNNLYIYIYYICIKIYYIHSNFIEIIFIIIFY